jgi:glycosyltransferase involved in cell wall biosynthesis
VRFLGYVPDEDLPALYSGALLLAFPSLYEGFGLPVLEAMACGTPVLTSNVSATAEVADGAALLVDPRSVDALASALGRLLTDDALRADLRRRGLARAAEFSWERTARETLSVYEKVAARS